MFVKIRNYFIVSKKIKNKIDILLDKNIGRKELSTKSFFLVKKTTEGFYIVSEIKKKSFREIKSMLIRLSLLLYSLILKVNPNAFPTKELLKSMVFVFYKRLLTSNFITLLYYHKVPKIINSLDDIMINPYEFSYKKIIISSVIEAILETKKIMRMNTKNIKVLSKTYLI
uniref:Uncharacterized protein n=1 Tax=Amorphochlora amoebiformis TaxID=1561963 RepID=A0A0H5BKT9_9EUKA|nr:hypothetical protein [Amorphochlora amoebiformis]